MTTQELANKLRDEEYLESRGYHRVKCNECEGSGKPGWAGYHEDVKCSYCEDGYVWIKAER